MAASTTRKTLILRASRSKAVCFMQMCVSQPYSTTDGRLRLTKCASTSGVIIENFFFPSKIFTPGKCLFVISVLMGPKLTYVVEITGISRICAVWVNLAALRASVGKLNKCFSSFY